jgi:hypothetical protein
MAAACGLSAMDSFLYGHQGLGYQQLILTPMPRGSLRRGNQYTRQLVPPVFHCLSAAKR